MRPGHEGACRACGQDLTAAAPGSLPGLPGVAVSEIVSLDTTHISLTAIPWQAAQTSLAVACQPAGAG